MKQALILGCSHAAGAEMHNGIACSYPVKIAEQLGYAPKNYAISGGSNDAMFRIYQEQCSGLDSSDIVIACWSGFNRTEIWNDKNKNWQALAPGKTDVASREYSDYQQQWVTYHTDERVGRYNKIKNIIALNTLAQQQPVSVINVDSFWPVHDFIWPDFIHWPITVDFWKWCNDNNYPRTEWGHFFEPAHQEFAEIVTNSIKMRLTKYK
jgi:hypothetical protein